MSDELKYNDELTKDEDQMSQPYDSFPYLGEIKTTRFSLGPQIHARQAIIRRAGSFGLAMALSVVTLIVCGLAFDFKLLYIAAIIAFILFPTLRFFGWYGILTSKCAVSSLFPQEIALSADNELTIDYFELPDHDATPPTDLLIPRHLISDCVFWGNYLIVSYDHHRELIIPMSAFANTIEAASFQRRLESLRHLECDF